MNKLFQRSRGGVGKLYRRSGDVMLDDQLDDGCQPRHGIVGTGTRLDHAGLGGLSVRREARHAKRNDDPAPTSQNTGPPYEGGPMLKCILGR